MYQCHTFYQLQPIASQNSRQVIAFYQTAVYPTSKMGNIINWKCLMLTKQRLCMWKCVIRCVTDILLICGRFVNFVWLRITDEGSLPEMRIWSILLIKSDLKWCIHLSRGLFLYCKMCRRGFSPHKFYKPAIGRKYISNRPYLHYIGELNRRNIYTKHLMQLPFIIHE